jgi:hypothetical protein
MDGQAHCGPARLVQGGRAPSQGSDFCKNEGRRGPQKENRNPKKNRGLRRKTMKKRMNVNYSENFEKNGE